MRQVHRPFVFAAISIIAVACSAPTATAPASATAEPTPSASLQPSPNESGAPASTPEPIPSDELGPFTCDLPLHESATVALANITDVRTGTHEGFDRVVFEFNQGLPEASLERATPPFAHDATGEPIEVQGSSFLRLIMRGGTKQTAEGTSSYDGPREFETGYPALVHLVEGGDFEAQSTWYFGLAAESCVRILTLTDDGSARLVIDIEH
jgi:hypothetical protein